jgi:2-dehydro-3-deoxyphosphogluconate aldolase / (4S)-4-hydroxy-2-oxoglutarate aldolase
MGSNDSNIEKSALTICEAGMVPVFYHDSEETCKQVVAACYKAGLRVFEFTNRGKNALINFKSIKKFIDANCPGMLLGAGTLFSYNPSIEFTDAGASFIVSPAFMPSMVSVQTNSKILWIPGCATISELAQARELGAVMMKIFPGELLGPKFAKAALSVMPGIRIMPTGGVEPTKESLSSWFGSGVSAVGMGSQLFSKELIERGDWKALEEKIKKALDFLNEIRSGK